jgi:hypothetical protein
MRLPLVTNSAEQMSGDVYPSLQYHTERFTLHDKNPPFTIYEIHPESYWKQVRGASQR